MATFGREIRKARFGKHIRCNGFWFFLVASVFQSLIFVPLLFLVPFFFNEDYNIMDSFCEGTFGFLSLCLFLLFVCIITLFIQEICGIYGSRISHTFLRPSQIPRDTVGDGVTSEVVTGSSNQYKFGRTCLVNGCFLTPQLGSLEVVQPFYELIDCSTADESSELFSKPKSGFWKVFASSSHSNREKIIKKFQITLWKYFWQSFGFLLAVVLLVFFCHPMIIFEFWLLLDDNNFKSDLDRSYKFQYRLHVYVFIFLISFLSQFFVHLYSSLCGLSKNFIIVTDSRVVITSTKFFNHIVEYLFFEDFETIQVKEDGSIDIGFSQEFIERIKGSFKITKDSKFSTNTIFKHVEKHFKGKREELEEFIEFVKKAKEDKANDLFSTSESDSLVESDISFEGSTDPIESDISTD